MPDETTTTATTTGTTATTASSTTPSAETVTALSGRLREETEKRQAAEQRAARAEHLEHTLAVFQATGLVDQELADLTIAHWDRLPKTDRPKLADWAAGLKTAPPRWAQGYFGSTAAGGSAAKTTATDGVGTGGGGGTPTTPLVLGAPVASVTGGATGAVPLATGGSSSAPVITPDAMRALRAEAKRTGDWSKVQAASKAAKQLK